MPSLSRARTRVCGWQFCYFCFSTDKSHHNQPCNAPPPPEAQSAQSDLLYFMHYFDRYDGHRKSEALETALRDRVTSRMDAMLDDPNRMAIRVDVEYLTAGAEGLIACRRLLKNTYPFAHYIARGSSVKLIFEHLQARLESVTEALAGLLEWTVARLRRPSVSAGTASWIHIRATAAPPFRVVFARAHPQLVRPQLACAA